MSDFNSDFGEDDTQDRLTIVRLLNLIAEYLLGIEAAFMPKKRPLVGMVEKSGCDGFECEETTWTHVEERLFALVAQAHSLADMARMAAQILEMPPDAEPDDTRPDGSPP